MNKIYVGCSLTHATQEFRDQIEVLKARLGEKYEVLKFLGLGVGTGREQYEWDTNCVRSANFFVAEVSYPSTGLGIELGVAAENDVPVMMLAHKDARVATMLQGIPNLVKDVVRYETILDLIPEIEQTIDTYARKTEV